MNIIKDGDWPMQEHYSVYSCRCITCSNMYCGPKRSSSCWSCAGEVMKDQFKHDMAKRIV